MCPLKYNQIARFNVRQLIFLSFEGEIIQATCIILAVVYIYIEMHKILPQCLKVITMKQLLWIMDICMYKLDKMTRMRHKLLTQITKTHLHV